MVLNVGGTLETPERLKSPNAHLIPDSLNQKSLEVGSIPRKLLEKHTVCPRDLLKNTITLGSILRLGYLLPNLLCLYEMYEITQKSGTHQKSPIIKGFSDSHNTLLIIY